MLRKLVCRAVGHRLETAVHVRKPDLWCNRCRRIIWWVHPSGLIVHWDATAADLERLGVKTSGDA